MRLLTPQQISKQTTIAIVTHTLPYIAIQVFCKLNCLVSRLINHDFESHKDYKVKFRKNQFTEAVKSVEEIKSAWEIAQEKAGKLGNLSSEEREKQRESKCRLIGESLAEKYLAQGDIRDLEFELGKHDGPDKDLIIQAAIERLTEGINLGNSLMLDKLFKGIITITHGKTAETISELKALAQEYKEAEDKTKQEIDRNGREILHQLRISGTAIGQTNYRAKTDWQEKMKQLDQPFEEKLNKLKQEVLNTARAQ